MSLDKNFAIYHIKEYRFIIRYIDDSIVNIAKIYDNELIDIVDFKTSLTDEVYRQFCEYFDGKRKKFDFKYKLIGTDFQKKVWRSLLNIEYGKTSTYKEVAISIDNEKACRAVGLANNKNPLLIAIPCHRVIASNKSLSGYAGGIEMKRKLIKFESTFL